MTDRIIKILGFAVTFAGIGVGLLGDYVNEKKQDEKIKREVREALAEKNEDKTEEES